MKYRAEIDGLRAIAVVPVIFFHAGFELFSGGFVGVDVFFVISGYLITTIILTEKELGKFSLVNFYERRARRILPALFLVMFVSLPFAWLWLIPSQLKSFSQSLVAVSTFSSNIFFSQDTGYWGAASELKPLLHTWSLAVEEQYYVLFPLYLISMWRFRKRWIFGSFVVITTISLVAAQLGTLNHLSTTFFLLQTRAWELAIGACIAFYFLYRKQTIQTLLSHKSIDETLSLIGLLMIVYAVFAFDESVPFPGVYALVPTLGTGLIILFSSQQTMVGRLLGNKLLVGLGLISYSAYLWHQPLFAFARNRSMTDPSELIFVVLAILSIALAYLSWRYFEMPFRKKRGLTRQTVFTFAAVGTTLFIVIGLIGSNADGFHTRFKMNPSMIDSLTENRIRASANCEKNYETKYRGKEVCTLGNKTHGVPIRFAVFGDSHADALLPAFDLSAKSINEKYVHSGLGGCPSLLGVDVVKGNFNKGVCEDIASRQFEFVKNNGIEKVFLVTRWSLYTDGDFEADMKRYFLIDKNSQIPTKEASRAVFERGLKNTVEKYQSIGASVYIVYQIPQQIIDPKKFYYKLSFLRLNDDEISAIIASKSISLDRSNNLQAFNRSVFEQFAVEENVKVLNLDDYYCSAGTCLIGDSDHSYYTDKDHVSVFGAFLVVQELKKHIK